MFFFCFFFGGGGDFPDFAVLLGLNGSGGDDLIEGGQGADWYRYVLTSGRSRITGLRPGTLEEVTAYARNCAAEFNLRSATGKGSAVVAYTRRK